MPNPQKEVLEVVAEARKQGWGVKEKKKGWALLDPSGDHLEILHKTPSDPKGLRHSVSRMRKYGFKWKGR
jgi:hypothetical protein